MSPALPNIQPTSPSGTPAFAWPIPGDRPPVRVDAGELAQRAGLVDPLAPVMTPGDAVYGEGFAAGAGPLADLIDRATAQLVIFRRTMEEAVRVDRTAQRHVSDLSARVVEAERAAALAEQRTSEIRRLAEIIETAPQTTESLRQMLEQIRVSHEAIQSYVDAQMSRQRSGFDARIAAHHDTITALLDERENQHRLEIERHRAFITERIEQTETHLGEQLSAIEHRLESASFAASERARARAEETAKTIEQTLLARFAQLSADLDRQAAQTQARVNLIVDEAQTRLAGIETGAGAITASAAERLAGLREQADGIMGPDPRSGRLPEPGTLAHAIRVAEQNLVESSAAAARLEKLAAGARTASDELAQAVESSRALVEEQESRRAASEHATIEASRGLDAVRDHLTHALDRSSSALAQSDAAVRTVASVRAELDSLSANAKAHLAQAREADALLARAAEQAHLRAQALQRTIELATKQAADAGSIARDLGTLIARGETSRGAVARPAIPTPTAHAPAAPAPAPVKTPAPIAPLPPAAPMSTAAPTGAVTPAAAPVAAPAPAPTAAPAPAPAPTPSAAPATRPTKISWPFPASGQQAA